MHRVGQDLTISPLLVVITVGRNGNSDIGEDANTETEVFIVTRQVGCPVDFNRGLLRRQNHDERVRWDDFDGFSTLTAEIKIEWHVIKK